MKCYRLLTPSAVSSDIGYTFFLDRLAELFLGSHLFPPPARRERDFLHRENFTTQLDTLLARRKLNVSSTSFPKQGVESQINSPFFGSAMLVTCVQTQ